MPALRQAEDAYVDELLGAAPDHGATLIAALFPRSYIDVNRAIDDIDPAVIEGEWPVPLHPTERSRLGVGLIRWLCRPGMSMYDGRLPAPVIADRIDRYYRPYHFQVASVLESFVGRFGQAWYIDCHSMPSRTPGGPARRATPDFVIGDRDGRTEVLPAEESTAIEPGDAIRIELRRSDSGIAPASTCTGAACPS